MGRAGYSAGHGSRDSLQRRWRPQVRTKSAGDGGQRHRAGDHLGEPQQCRQQRMGSRPHERRLLLPCRSITVAPEGQHDEGWNMPKHCRQEVLSSRSYPRWPASCSAAPPPACAPHRQRSSCLSRSPGLAAGRDVTVTSPRRPSSTNTTPNGPWFLCCDQARQALCKGRGGEFRCCRTLGPHPDCPGGGSTGYLGAGRAGSERPEQRGGGSGLQPRRQALRNAVLPALVTRRARPGR